jgi:DNA invertase Pin-like site-specific DNA recombinase
MTQYGYIRVSTCEQNEDRQLVANQSYIKHTRSCELGCRWEYRSKERTGKIPQKNRGNS